MEAQVGSCVMAAQLWISAASAETRDVALLMGEKSSWFLCGGGKISGFEGMEDKQRS